MQTTDRILVVDDDRDAREPLAAYLRMHGLRAVAVSSARQMRTALRDEGPFDLIVLDHALPGEDMQALCHELHSGALKAIPKIVHTARKDEADRIVSLEMGADDYLAKPFSFRELIARIRTVLRRTRMPPPDFRWAQGPGLLSFGDWTLDTDARQLVHRNDTKIELSGAEYRLLRAFVDHPHQPLSRNQLLVLTRGPEARLTGRSIDHLTMKLRVQLGDDARLPRYIKTVRGTGYAFAADVSAAPREAPRHEQAVAA